jgi:hypothetical protein
MTLMPLSLLDAHHGMHSQNWGYCDILVLNPQPHSHEGKWNWLTSSTTNFLGNLNASWSLNTSFMWESDLMQAVLSPNPLVSLTCLSIVATAKRQTNCFHLIGCPNGNRRTRQVVHETRWCFLLKCTCIQLKLSQNERGLDGMFDVAPSQRMPPFDEPNFSNQRRERSTWMISHSKDTVEKSRSSVWRIAWCGRTEPCDHTQRVDINPSEWREKRPSLVPCWRIVNMMPFTQSYIRFMTNF